MKLSTISFSQLLFACCILSLGLVLQSCDDDLSGGDDEITGCTDPGALNYDALATEDDGSCSFNSDRFLGVFLGELDCPPNEVFELSNDSAGVEITMGVFDTRDSVTLTIAVQGFPLNLQGLITGNTVDVTGEFRNLPFVVEEQLVTIDIEANALVTLSEDESTLTGPITVQTFFSDSGATLVSSDCDYNGVRQE